jgi:uncharacterized protein YcsI (UPF0317 family)
MCPGECVIINSGLASSATDCGVTPHPQNSMRPMTMTQAIKATEITSHFKNVHGTPIHIGTPEIINSGLASSATDCGVTPHPQKTGTSLGLIVTASPFKNVHGTPIHIGTPEELGITDIDKPDYGEAVTIKPLK